MGLQAFPFRSTYTKCFPLVKKQRKAKKNIRQGGNSVCYHPTSAPLENWTAVQKAWTLGLLPLLPLHLLKYVCFLFLACQSKPNTGVSRETLTCTSSFCDSHLSPRTASEGLSGVAALPDILALCKNTFHSLWWLVWSTGAERDGEGGRWRDRVSRCARLKDCWEKFLEFSPHPSVSFSPQKELKAEPTNPVAWQCQWLL